jgi:hypothetical protein
MTSSGDRTKLLRWASTVPALNTVTTSGWSAARLANSIVSTLVAGGVRASSSRCHFAIRNRASVFAVESASNIRAHDYTYRRGRPPDPRGRGTASAWAAEVDPSRSRNSCFALSGENPPSCRSLRLGTFLTRRRALVVGSIMRKRSTWQPPLGPVFFSWRPPLARLGLTVASAGTAPVHHPSALTIRNGSRPTSSFIGWLIAVRSARRARMSLQA